MILGAVNCADEFNEKVCRDFRITGYPTLKVKFTGAGKGWEESRACLICLVSGLQPV